MARHNRSVPCGRVRRAMPLAGVTARAACGRVVAGLRERAGSEGAIERFHLSTASRYSELLGRSRGALMKAGQILSMFDTRAWGGGGFGPYLDALNQLQSDVPAMDYALVEEILSTEFGPVGRKFASFSKEPIATASIGQVHHAVLHDGREVAVKIQYPGVDQAIRDDLANAQLLVTFLRLATVAAGIKVDIAAVAHEAAARIREEVDYRHEAATLAAFGKLYQDHPFIRIPQVVPELSGDRVLTMTYLDGADWPQAQHADKSLKDVWAEAIQRFIDSNVRLANLVHADPHPSNYRFFTDGTVGFLDFGCVQVLTEQESYNWVAMTRAALEGRKSDLRSLMGQAGFLDDDPSLTADEVHQWWATLLHDVTTENQPVTYTPADTARVVSTMFDLRDRGRPSARVKVPNATVLAARIQLNLVSICAGLAATVPVRALVDDADGVAEPITELGRLHHEWVRNRGLSVLGRTTGAKSSPSTLPNATLPNAKGSQ